MAALEVGSSGGEVGVHMAGRVGTPVDLAAIARLEPRQLGVLDHLQETRVSTSQAVEADEDEYDGVGRFTLGVLPRHKAADGQRDAAARGRETRARSTARQGCRRP